MSAEAVIFTYSYDRKGIDEWCEDNLPVGTWALTGDPNQLSKTVILIYKKEVLGRIKDPLFTIRLMNQIWRVESRC